MDKNENKPLLDSAEQLTGSRNGKKKHIPGILVLAIVAIVCIGGLVVVYSLGQQTEEAASPSLVLTQLAGTELSSVEITRDDEHFVLLNDGGAGYQLEGNTAFMVNESVARRLIAQCTRLEAQSIVNEEAENMAEYGLELPETKITIRMRNGEERTVCIGYQSPASNYYASILGQKRVYAIAPTVAEALMLPMNELHALQTPAIKEPYAPAYLCIEWPDVAQKRSMQSLVIMKQPRKDVGIGASNYIMTQPFVYDVDVAMLALLVENIAAMKVESYIGERTTEALYEIDEAVQITVRDTAGTEVRLRVGAKADEQHRYICFNDEPAVYLISADAVSFLDDITLAGCIDRFIHLVSIDKLHRVIITSHTRTDTLVVERQPEQVYLINGRTLNEDVFKNFYQELCGLTANGIVTSTEELGEAELRVEFELTGDVKLSVEYIELDREHYAVRRDGSVYVYVQKSKVMKLLEQLYTLETADGNEHITVQTMK